MHWLGITDFLFPISVAVYSVTLEKEKGYKPANISITGPKYTPFLLTVSQWRLTCNF